MISNDFKEEHGQATAGYGSPEADEHPLSA